MLRFLSLSLRWGQNNNQPKTRPSKALSRCKSFYDDRRGTVAVMMGISLPIFIGFLGMAVDVPNWYLSQRKAQTAVDAGAISGAYSLYYSEDSYESESAAAEGAKRNEFVADSGRTLTVNIPPLSGPYAGDNTAVEVIGTELQTVFLASLIMDDEVYIQVRAVARAAQDRGEVCVLALDPEGQGAITFSGTSDTGIGCDVHSNSKDPQSVWLKGGAEGVLGNISAVGEIDIGTNTDFDMSEVSPLSWMIPIKNPYGVYGANLQVPSSPVSCDFTRLVVKDEVTLMPGRYCDGISASTGSEITFAPGIYIIDGGTFEASSSAYMFGEDVTFVLTGSGKDYAMVQFNGGAEIDLSASKSGEFEGILFFQDPNAGKGTKVYQNKFNGGSSLRLVGTLYFPNQELVYNGGATISNSCLQIVALRVTFNGNATVGKNNCPNDMQLAGIKLTRIKLVE